MQLRGEFTEAAQQTITQIADKFQKVLRQRAEARGKKWKKNKKLTFIGIHSRRGDYKALMKQKAGLIFVHLASSSGQISHIYTPMLITSLEEVGTHQETASHQMDHLTVI